MSSVSRTTLVSITVWRIVVGTNSVNVDVAMVPDSVNVVVMRLVIVATLVEICVCTMVSRTVSTSVTGGRVTSGSVIGTVIGVVYTVV
jgi:hypothetical protein